MVTLTALKDVEVETLIYSALLDKRYSSTFISFTITQGEWAQATDYRNVRQLAPWTISPRRLAPSLWTISPQSLDN